MTLKPCSLCGKDVRLGAFHITANRRRGVAHYIAHKGDDDGCKAPQVYTSSMLKPYPKTDAEKPWFHMCQRWNADQERLL